VVEDFGHDAAVWVVPAGDAGGVASVKCVLKDGLVLAEGLPFAGGGFAKREETLTAFEGRPVKSVGRMKRVYSPVGMAWVKMVDWAAS
jgi:hypothetical protein